MIHLGYQASTDSPLYISIGEKGGLDKGGWTERAPHAEPAARVASPKKARIAEASHRNSNKRENRPQCMPIIEEVAKSVEDACKQQTNYFGYGIWPHHILHVVRFGKELAEKKRADSEIVVLAAYLHDYASVKSFEHYKDHHITGAQETQSLLENLSYPQDRIDRVKEAIINHRGSVLSSSSSIEAMILRDADAMAHFVSVPSLLYLAHNSHKMEINEASAWVLQKLDRSWNKLSPEAQQMVEMQYNAARILLQPPSTEHRI
jgi:uncharacterized protein